MNELVLLKECLQGKPESQKQLYEHFAPKMMGVCYRYAGSREEAEDFLQEAFITIFKKLNQFKGEGELGGWIYKIVVNTSLNCIKARHKFRENINIIPIDLVTENVHSRQAESEKDLIKLIHELPRGYRTIFNLYGIEGYSHDEIAKMLNIKASTSRSQYTRAREMLMKKVNSEINFSKNILQHG